MPVLPLHITSQLYLLIIFDSLTQLDGEAITTNSLVSLMTKNMNNDDCIRIYTYIGPTSQYSDGQLFFIKQKHYLKFIWAIRKYQRA